MNQVSTNVPRFPIAPVLTFSFVSKVKPGAMEKANPVEVLLQNKSSPKLSNVTQTKNTLSCHLKMEPPDSLKKTDVVPGKHTKRCQNADQKILAK